MIVVYFIDSTEEMLYDQGAIVIHLIKLSYLGSFISDDFPLRMLHLR